MMLFDGFHVAHADFQRVCPIGNFHAECLFDLRLVKHRIRRTFHRTGEFIAVTRLNVTSSITCKFGYFLCEVEPRAYALVAEVIYAFLAVTRFGAFFFIISQHCFYSNGKVVCVSRRAGAWSNTTFSFGLCSRKVEHSS